MGAYSNEVSHAAREHDSPSPSEPVTGSGSGAADELPTGATAGAGAGTTAARAGGAGETVVQIARLDWRSGAWIAGGLFVAFVSLGLLRNIPSSLTRIAIGVLLALALDPLVVRIRSRLGCPRAAAVAIVASGLAVIFGFLVLVLGPPAIQQAEEFGSELPDTVRELYSFPVVGGWLEERNAATEVDRWAEDLPASVDTQSVTEVARSVLDGVLAGMMVIVVGLAVLIDGDRLVARFQRACPPNLDGYAVRVGRTLQRVFGAYFAGSLLVASLAAIFILSVGLAFGVPLAPAAALWMLMVNLIPQIGGFLGGSFFGILALTQGVGTGLICLALFLIYQNVENHLIQPMIVGEAVDLSPPTTMLAALVGGATAGVPGALIATPLVGAAKSLYLELRWGISMDAQGLSSPTQRIRRRIKRRTRGAAPEASGSVVTGPAAPEPAVTEPGATESAAVEPPP
jgi:putative heme transporter